MDSQIYFDNHSTTRVDPSVLAEMWPWFGEEYGNAGSVTHQMGERAGEVVEACRGSLANVIGATPGELVFTSGATESNNLALEGFASRQSKPGHVISVTTEHRAVLDPVRRLQRHGFRISWVGVHPAGHPRAGEVDLDQLAEAWEPDTALVSVMLANNEIGVIQPIAEIAALCRAHDALLHTDATQAVGRIPVNVDQLDVDLLSFSAHKFYGPKGVGALYLRQRTRRVRLLPLLVGGGQEHGRRSGTLNVPGIVGMAAALRISQEQAPVESERIEGLRNRLWRRLRDELPGLILNGPDWENPEAPPRLGGNLNIQFPGIDGHSLMAAVPQLAISSGSACSAADPTPSHVLTNLGLDEDQVRSSLRFGLGRFNDADEVDRAAEILSAAVRRLRGLIGEAREGSV